MKMQVQKKGSSGKNVKALQILLIGNGYSCGSWGADGKFGVATEKAVFRYQKEKGLQQDGMAGPETWGSLLSIFVTIQVFLSYNFWKLYLLGIPGQIAIFLWFRMFRPVREKEPREELNNG